MYICKVIVSIEGTVASPLRVEQSRTLSNGAFLQRRSLGEKYTKDGGTRGIITDRDQLSREIQKEETVEWMGAKQAF